mgnify:CR=1 FL=1
MDFMPVLQNEISGAAKNLPIVGCCCHCIIPQCLLLGGARRQLHGRWRFLRSGCAEQGKEPRNAQGLCRCAVLKDTKRFRVFAGAGSSQAFYHPPPAINTKQNAVVA